MKNIHLLNVTFYFVLNLLETVSIICKYQADGKHVPWSKMLLQVRPFQRG